MKKVNVGIKNYENEKKMLKWTWQDRALGNMIQTSQSLVGSSSYKHKPYALGIMNNKAHKILTPISLVVVIMSQAI